MSLSNLKNRRVNLITFDLYYVIIKTKISFSNKQKSNSLCPKWKLPLCNVKKHIVYPFHPPCHPETEIMKMHSFLRCIRSSRPEPDPETSLAPGPAEVMIHTFQLLSTTTRRAFSDMMIFLIVSRPLSLCVFFPFIFFKKGNENNWMGIKKTSGVDYYVNEMFWFYIYWPFRSSKYLLHHHSLTLHGTKT